MWAEESGAFSCSRHFSTVLCEALLNAESSVLGNGKTGTKLPEIGHWLAEIGHSPFPSSGS